MGSATSRRVWRGSEVRILVPAETILDSGHGNTPRAAALLIGSPALRRVPGVVVATTLSPRALSPGPSTTRSVLARTRPFTYQPHHTPVWTGIFEGEKFEVTSHPGLSEFGRSAGTLYSVCPVQSRSLSEAGSVELLMPEIRSPCSS